ncbi:Y-family DNA polymerase [Candidatus Dependentiae bacterium]|nr:Y-family DNA polymerase [Candidatus Dependentiae bacterium]
MNRFALVDCNNFFVSCERVFNPKLNRKPVVVLSSNDACIIARSNEAKKLGIKMGQPAWECRDILIRNKVQVYSSNFTLYGDMSSRVMAILTECSTDIEIYSVDEAFIYFPSASDFYDGHHYTSYAQHVRNKIKQDIGLPVSIGIGPTKTLAKIAGDIAKKRNDGVFDITNHPDADNIFKLIDVRDIWGIGSRYAEKLYARSIRTVFDFINCDERWVRKNLTINGLRTLTELRGTPCFDLHTQPEPRQSLTVSRLFGRNVTEFKELHEGLATHLSIAAEKLRKQKMKAQQLIVFVSYTQYQDSTRIYRSAFQQLPLATSYTPDLLAAGTACLQSLFHKGFTYKKVGIIIDDLVPQDALQMNTFYQLPTNLEKQAALMKTIDRVNAKMGKNKLAYASAGLKKEWKNKQEKRSPAYTTNWHELLTIKI